MKISIALAVIAAVTVTASGCKRGKGEADCKAAANAYANLLRETVESENKNPEKKAQALSVIPTLKDEMAKTCERDKWPASQRACFAAAKIKGDLERCMSARAPAPETEPEAAPATPTPEPDPAATAPTDETKPATP
jgi:hypothetical protein